MCAIDLSAECPDRPDNPECVVPFCDHLIEEVLRHIQESPEFFQSAKLTLYVTEATAERVGMGTQLTIRIETLGSINDIPVEHHCEYDRHHMDKDGGLTLIATHGLAGWATYKMMEAAVEGWRKFQMARWITFFFGGTDQPRRLVRLGTIGS